MSGFELSLFEQLTVEHHVLAFFWGLDFCSDETSTPISAILMQNKKNTCQTKLHFEPMIADKRIARFKEISREDRRKVVSHLKFFLGEGMQHLQYCLCC